ncbi:MAG TPA: tol-pal system protein YbgF [Dissulfurispiraceae bacterium]|nr:tol-pal system protein YbgF [Dissulfurispiraceae bacterium]
MILRGTGTVIPVGGYLLFKATLRRFLLPALSVISLVMFGCATGSEMEATRSNVSQLQIQSVTRDKDISQLKEQVDSLSKDMGTLTAIRESQTNLLTQVGDYSKDLQALRGRFDENKYFMDKTIKDLTSEIELQKARITALENDLKTLKSPTAAKGESKGAAEGADKTSAVDTEKGPDDAAKLYDEAHIAFKAKKYSEARKMFERYVKDHPKETLTANSYFWIGETYYSEKKYEDAILAYEDFLKKYPKHEKVRGAMLKQGFSFLELKDKKTGKVILESLIEKYPKSKEAEVAQKRLKELSATPPAATKPKKKK